MDTCGCGTCAGCEAAEVVREQATKELWDRLHAGGQTPGLLWENLEDNYEPGIDCEQWLRATLEDFLSDAVMALRGICPRCLLDHSERFYEAAMQAIDEEVAAQLAVDWAKT